MRTTVDIDDDLLTRLRAEATRRRVPFKHLLNRLLRAGLSAGPRPNAGRYRCPTHAMGAPLAGANLDKALALAEALGDDGVRQKLEHRK
jgi:hypothetical protein